MEIDSYLKQKPDVALARKLKTLVWLISALVLGLVASMRPLRPWFLSLIEKPDGLVLSFLLSRIYFLYYRLCNAKHNQPVP